MSTDLYQKCEHCNGTGESPTIQWRLAPRCPSCNGEKFYPIGLSLAQVDRYVHESHHFYHPDGSVERLHSADQVKSQRIDSARELDRLRKEVDRLRKDVVRLNGEIVVRDNENRNGWDAARRVEENLKDARKEIAKLNGDVDELIVERERIIRCAIVKYSGSKFYDVSFGRDTICNIPTEEEAVAEVKKILGVK